MSLSYVEVRSAVLEYVRSNSSKAHQQVPNRLPIFGKFEEQGPRRRILDDDRALKQQTSLEFAPVPQFTRETLEKRSELLYAMTKQIWQV